MLEAAAEISAAVSNKGAARAAKAAKTADAAPCVAAPAVAPARAAPNRRLRTKTKSQPPAKEKARALAKPATAKQIRAGVQIAAYIKAKTIALNSGKRLDEAKAIATKAGQDAIAALG